MTPAPQTKIGGTGLKKLAIRSLVICRRKIASFLRFCDTGAGKRANDTFKK